MKKMKIVRNRIKCAKCGDIIESYSVHDFKFCKCGAIAVDGGHDYLRRLGEREDWIDMSETKEVEEPEEPYQVDDSYDALIPDWDWLQSELKELKDV